MTLDYEKIVKEANTTDFEKICDFINDTFQKEGIKGMKKYEKSTNSTPEKKEKQRFKRD